MYLKLNQLFNFVKCFFVEKRAQIIKNLLSALHGVIIDIRRLLWMNIVIE